MSLLWLENECMLKIRLVLFCQIKNERVIINLRLDILNNFCNMEAKGKF